MRVKVLFFGMLKDIVGRSEDAIEVAEGQDLGSLFDLYAGRFPRIGEMASSIVLAQNHEFRGRNAPLAPGDEIAFLPPVSGGAGPHPAGLSAYTHELSENDCFFALTRLPINAGLLIRRILRPEDGAVVNFEGVVRNNTQGRATKYLEYECYEPMAIKVMAEIGRGIAAASAIGRLAIVHRLGRMEIGETSVAVIVTAPHRRAAFEAALEGIDRLKRLVPIWKKEYLADSGAWVEGEWDESVLGR